MESRQPDSDLDAAKACWVIACVDELERREVERLAAALVAPADRPRILAALGVRGHRGQYAQYARRACPDPVAAAAAFAVYTVSAGERRLVPGLVSQHVRGTLFGHGVPLQALSILLDGDGYGGAGAGTRVKGIFITGRYSVTSLEWQRVSALLACLQAAEQKLEAAAERSSLAELAAGAVADRLHKPVRPHLRATINGELIALCMHGPLREGPPRPAGPHPRRMGMAA